MDLGLKSFFTEIFKLLKGIVTGADVQNLQFLMCRPLTLTLQFPGHAFSPREFNVPAVFVFPAPASEIVPDLVVSPGDPRAVRAVRPVLGGELLHGPGVLLQELLLPQVLGPDLLRSPGEGVIPKRFVNTLNKCCQLFMLLTSHSM